MIYIKASNDIIELISINKIEDYTCALNFLPEDFYTYLSDGKYLANQSGLYVKDGWVDLTAEQLAARDRLRTLSDNDYGYIIVPNELIPSLTDMAMAVEDVCFAKEFTYKFGTTEVTAKNGKKGKLTTLYARFTPCKIWRWEEGDDAKIQEVVDTFNSLYDPPRKIDFSLKFLTFDELNAFIIAQKNK